MMRRNMANNKNEHDQPKKFKFENYTIFTLDQFNDTVVNMTLVKVTFRTPITILLRV